MNDTMTDALTARFLHVAIRALRLQVVPDITSPQARLAADLVTRVLHMLESRFARRGPDLDRLIGRTRDLLRDIDAALPAPVAQAEAPPAAQAFSAIERREQDRFALELQLSDRLPALLALSRTPGPDGVAAVDLLRRVVDVQQSFLAAQDPDILKGSHVCYQGGRIDEERIAQAVVDADRQVTQASLAAYLDSRRSGDSADDVAVIAGGFSKSTVLFTRVQVTGEREELVMRRDMPTCHFSSVTDEFPLLQKLFENGFAVAEPRWVEADPGVFGQAFMVSRRVSGSTDVSRWAGDARLVDAFARQLAATMAHLHALPLTSLGYAADVAGASAGEMMQVEIERWRRILVGERREAYPVLDLALGWLRENIPATLFARPAALVHGDIGFHNLMIDGDRVTAVLDWEFAHPGDPVEDLVYTLPFVGKVMDWERFKAYYREAGGWACTPEEEFFYQLWSKVRNPIACVRVAAQFADAPQDNIQFAVSGFILGRYLELEAGRTVVDALSASR